MRSRRFASVCGRYTRGVRARVLCCAMDTPDSKQQGGKPGSVTSSIQSAFKVMMNRHISWPWSPRLVYHVNPSVSHSER